MSKPLVAIRCLVYNHEAYIRDCLNGFVKQRTKFDFVTIVHDDCSTDKSAAIIREYAEKYPDIIKPILETENQYSKKDGSFYRILQDALQTTGAKYVAFCEGDDYWTDPLKLQKQVDYMEAHPEVGLCYTDYNQKEGTSSWVIPSLFEQQHQYRPESYEQHLLKPGYLAPMTWLYRMVLSEYIMNSQIYSDGTFSFVLELMRRYKFGYLPVVTATYRTHKGSASSPSNHQQMFIYMKGIFDTQRYYTEKYPCDEELRRKIYLRGYLNLLPVAVMAGNDEFVEEARRYMESQDLNIDLIIRELKQGEMKKHSRSYRLGKAILRPFMWIKK